MTKHTYKRTYFNLAMQQELPWLKAVVLEERRFNALRPIHLALIKLAIRKKGGVASTNQTIIATGH
jgi:hypothetical protein